MAPFVTSATFFAFALIVFFAGIRSQEVENESEFEYEEGPKGPEYWGELKEEWKTCGNGTYQSPIDVVKRYARINPDMCRLRRIYGTANGTLINRGHDIMVFVEGFALEHASLESHLVHQVDNDEIAVVGILYKFDRPDTFLSKLMDEIVAIGDMELLEELLGMVNPKHIKWGSRKYYRYTGSVTTPPCTEVVIWNVIHKNYDKNARPIQLKNGKMEELFTNILPNLIST